MNRQNGYGFELFVKTLSISTNERAGKFLFFLFGWPFLRLFQQLDMNRPTLLLLATFQLKTGIGLPVMEIIYCTARIKFRRNPFFLVSGSELRFIVFHATFCCTFKQYSQSLPQLPYRFFIIFIYVFLSKKQLAQFSDELSHL